MTDITAITSIDLLRHGKTQIAPGAQGLFGQTDVPLSDEGWQQMSDVSRLLGKPDMIISSPLQRCWLFASDYAAQIQCPWVKQSDFKECNFGQWDGVPFNELKSQWQALDAFWENPLKNPPPNGEPLSAMRTRVLRAWEQCLRTFRGQHTLIITHGGVIRLILAEALGIDWRQPSWYIRLRLDYASISRIEIGAHPDCQPEVKFMGLTTNALTDTPKRHAKF